jgi:hypothetical protein
MNLKFWDPKSIWYINRQQRIDQEWQIEITVLRFSREKWKIVNVDNWIEVYWIWFMALRMFDWDIIYWDWIDDFDEYTTRIDETTLDDYDVCCDTMVYNKEKECFFISLENLIKR